MSIYCIKGVHECTTLSSSCFFIFFIWVRVCLVLLNSMNLNNGSVKKVKPKIVEETCLCQIGPRLVLIQKREYIYLRTCFLTWIVVLVCSGVALSGVGMMLWVTVTELLHQLRNVHHDLDYTCPTAKTGLFGGAAFLTLDAMLLWIVTMMLVSNVREDLHRPDEDESEALQDNNVDAGYLM